MHGMYLGNRGMFGCPALGRRGIVCHLHLQWRRLNAELLTGAYQHRLLCDSYFLLTHQTEAMTDGRFGQHVGGHAGPEVIDLGKLVP